MGYSKMIRDLMEYNYGSTDDLEKRDTEMAIDAAIECGAADREEALRWISEV